MSASIQTNQQHFLTHFHLFLSLEYRHSHHNETNTPAWVLPIQDAGLYTHQRTLDIRFSEAPPAKV